MNVVSHADWGARNVIKGCHVSKQCHVNSTEYQNMELMKRVQVLTRALGDSVTQIYHLINYGESSKDQSGTDFMRMIHVDRLVTKLQAKFRQILAIKRQERRIEEQKEVIRRKEQ